MSYLQPHKPIVWTNFFPSTLSLVYLTALRSSTTVIINTLLPYLSYNFRFSLNNVQMFGIIFHQQLPGFLSR